MSNMQSTIKERERELLLYQFRVHLNGPGHTVSPVSAKVFANHNTPCKLSLVERYDEATRKIKREDVRRHNLATNN